MSGGPTTLENSSASSPAQHHAVGMLENGPVDVGRIPDHLQWQVDRNARASPLLRLPGEIRNIIWDYVFSDMIIHAKATAVHGAEDDRVQIKASFHEATLKEVISPSAFHIPRVCQHIYGERVTLPYAHVTCVFELGITNIYGNDLAIRTLASCFTLAAREQVETVQFSTVEAVRMTTRDPVYLNLLNLFV
ncbi:hypothetical protein P154DRAFT_575286 [Amniculicola lignicola CBS 123094]|uniref:DUF7730 domain-containing protein n=1 Tax=Amniculicola lignicola CBS 123094 TaxID=1392246 RepID=A0A6A5WK82_9PLEO|nr:hypothetical protein P154DRAFT_575286 [Amniculicola lignicola CBS 123094]